MDCTFDIFDTNTVLKGQFPLAQVVDITSYNVEGAQFSPQYRKGLWDGKKHLFNKRSGAFPTGLYPRVRKACEDYGCNVSITDHRSHFTADDADFALHGITMTGKYQFQADVVKKALAAKRGIIKASTGSGKSSMLAAITKALGPNKKALLIVPTVELLYQLQGSFKRFLQLSDRECGTIGDSEWSPGSWVTVATPGTLMSRLKTDTCIEFLGGIDLLMIDECHHAAAEEWYTVVSLCPAHYRIACSGTPTFRSDGADLRLIAATGELICDVSNKQLVDLGVVPRAHIIFDRITSPILPKKGTTYQTAYSSGVSKNPEVVEKVTEWVVAARNNDLSVLVLVDEIAHGKAIDEALWSNPYGVFIPHQFIHGSESTETRQSALEDFSTRSLPVLISSTILDEGVSVDSVDVLVLAGSRKSKIKTLQRLGRGLRGERLVAVEFANMCHKYLADHSMQRLQDYKAEECFPIFQYKNGEDRTELIKKLWDAQAK